MLVPEKKFFFTTPGCTSRLVHWAWTNDKNNDNNNNNYNNIIHNGK